MSSTNPQTFDCTICNSKHNLIPDALPTGHSGHKPHCLLCALHTLSRTIIPAAPTTRLTGEQIEKKNIIRTRKIVLLTIAPVIVLAYFSFRWQMKLWHRVAEGFGKGPAHLHEQLIFASLCVVALAPSGLIVGFGASVMYYVFWHFKKRREKRKKAAREAAEVVGAVALEEKPLAELSYRDLEEMNGKIQIVVTPPEQMEVSLDKRGKTSRVLGTVTDRFKPGYDGRAVRRESWRAMGEAEEPQGGRSKQSRPMTQWPEMQ